MIRKLLLALIPIVLLLGWLSLRRTAPPEVPFTPVTRQNLTSTLTTNGKIEPLEWAAVHAEAAGPITQLHVTRGQTVHAGQILATVGLAGAQAELSAAESRISQAQAEIETLQAGGRAQELAEIESGLVRTRTAVENARRELQALERLAARKAVPAAEVTAAREALRRSELEVEALDRRRSSLVTQPDRRAAQARLSEARSAADAASRRIATGVIRSPRAGIVYALEVRGGDFVQPGQLLARVGRLDQLRVVLYVDEPELGRVAKGMPVTISWDAQPGRTWTGEVEAMPLQVVPVGTRQVGEVICLIANPDLSLIPGTTINAEIRSRVVQNALTLPKEALRREGDASGVLRLDGSKVVWQPVKTGIASVTHLEVVSGLKEGDLVALPVDTPLKSGDPVKPASAG
ncbi:MAG TPA: efflux RND transporter periplasmic adaptor subunit [Bryobacteraceae bacterium]|nr:efflux RND transporter periplasmic adaptor subunit [Bryobacteraceae bacterium]